jgi:hypothetical protein
MKRLLILISAMLLCLVDMLTDLPFIVVGFLWNKVRVAFKVGTSLNSAYITFMLELTNKHDPNKNESRVPESQ